MVVLILGYALSKTAPRILIFSIAMGADNSFVLISIETYAPQFIGHNKFFLGSAAKTMMPIDNKTPNFFIYSLSSVW